MANKKLPIALISGAFISITGLWINTQRFASAVDYHPLLGKPITFFNDLPVYLPYKLIEWYSEFGDILPDVFKAIAPGLTMTYLLALGVIMLILKKEKKLDSHGTAEWATKEDIIKAELLADEGVMLGKTEEGEYLKHNGAEHALLMAPTRSGKGVGCIIPTLLSWLHSVIVTDIKGENWALTSGWRKAIGQIVIKLEPTADDYSTARFNPFDEIRAKTSKEIADTQNIANILVDPQGKGDLSHWQLSAASLMVGSIIYLKYVEPENASLGRLIELLTSPPPDDPEGDIRSVLQRMRTIKHVEDGDTIITDIYGKTVFDSTQHPIVCQTCTEMLNKADDELAGVVSTVTSILSVYRDPVLARNLATSDFSIKDLMNHEKPVSLYMVFPPSDIDRMTPIFRLIIEMIIRRSIEKMEFKDSQAVKAYKHRMLLILDEFPALGRLDTMERALAYIAGYGIKALLIVQSLNQLYKTYTENNSIIDNCHIRVFFTPNDDKTPGLISRLLGKYTRFVQSESTNKKDILAILSGSESTSQIGRDLMTADEVSKLNKAYELIFVAGFSPMKVKKIIYYLDKTFDYRNRKFKAPVKSDVIKTQKEVG